TAEQANMADRMKRYWATFAERAAHWRCARVVASDCRKQSIVMRFQPQGDAVVPWEQMVAEHHWGFWAQMGYGAALKAKRVFEALDVPARDDDGEPEDEGGQRDELRTHGSGLALPAP